MIQLHIKDPTLAEDPEVQEWLRVCAQLIMEHTEEQIAHFVAFGSIALPQNPKDDCPSL